MHKTVLHVINGEFYAGAERVQDLLALNLPGHGYHIQFACLKEGIFARDRESHDSCIHNTGMAGKFDLSAVNGIVRAIKLSECRIVHAHTPRSLIIASIAARIARKPVIYHVHGPTTHDTEQRLRNLVNATAESIFIRQVDRSIAVSSHAAEYAVSIGANKASMRLVPNGVPGCSQTAQTVTKNFVVGSVALFRPRKGLEVLIEAFSKLSRSTSKTCHLNLIGDFETESYRNQIMHQANSLGIAKQIKWIGHTRDINQRLQELSAFVLPSLYGEGMPMAILEAMAAGIPIVASRAGGIGEMLNDDIEGILVEPGNSDSMYLGLARLLEEPELRRLIGIRAKLRHHNEYSADTMARRVAAIYDEVLAEKMPSQ